MDKHGWIVSVEADVEVSQGTIYHGLIESLVVMETKSLDPALSHLPLSAEPFSAWGDDVDVRTFLRSISDDASTVIDPDGTVRTSREGKFTEEGWGDDLKAVAEDLEGFVTPRLSGSTSKISGLGPSWPKDDTKVGHAMKYVMAWRGLDREALEESRFFSVAHLLEATNEIESSVALAQGSFYKQAKQQLRSLLELVVMPLHFCTDRDSFRKWREGDYRTPQFRGPRGLLKQLVDRSLLSKQTADEIGDLYGRLSGSIHNEEKELAFSGVLGGGRPLTGFSIERLHEWADLCAATLNAAISAAIATMDAWDSNRPADPFCAGCHNETDFTIVAERFGQDLYDKITCMRCDTTIVRSLRLADPATEVEPMIPGFKFRVLSAEELNHRRSKLQLNVQDDNGGFTHFVPSKDMSHPISNQRPVTALCGWTWVPNKSPDDFPACPRCKAAFDELPDLQLPGGKPNSGEANNWHAVGTTQWPLDAAVESCVASGAAHCLTIPGARP